MCSERCVRTLMWRLERARLVHRRKAGLKIRIGGKLLLRMDRAVVIVRPVASASSGRKGARESARTRPEGNVGRERWEEFHRTWVDSMKASERVTRSAIFASI
jgi:hypothetical protein